MSLSRWIWRICGFRVSYFGTMAPVSTLRQVCWLLVSLAWASSRAVFQPSSSASTGARRPEGRVPSHGGGCQRRSTCSMVEAVPVSTASREDARPVSTWSSSSARPVSISSSSSALPVSSASRRSERPRRESAFSEVEGREKSSSSMLSSSWAHAGVAMRPRARAPSASRVSRMQAILPGGVIGITAFVLKWRRNSFDSPRPRAL